MNINIEHIVLAFR